MSDLKHKHILSPGLVNILKIMIEEVNKNKKNEFHIKDLNLNNTQFGNYQKLRFFGLIAKVKDREGRHIKGAWLITTIGGQFLRKEISVFYRVWTLNNHLISRDPNDFKTRMITDYYPNREFPWFQSIWVGENTKQSTLF